MKNKISKINKLLVRRFGIPKRNKKLPDPVDLIIATILSQNTNDKNSFKAFQNLKKKFNNWEETAKTDIRKIESIIRIAGLGKQKSAAIKNLLKELINKNGKISLDYLRKRTNDNVLNELVSFKGVGVKTASCVLLFSFDRNICPVDTHVHRTLNRTGLVQTKTPDKTFDIINKQLPPDIAHQFHTNLIRLGREICRSAKPVCFVCPLVDICMYESKNLTPVENYRENSFMLLDNVN